MKVSRFTRLASILAVAALVMSVLCFLPAKKVEAGTRGYDGAYIYEMLDDGTVSIYWYDSAQSGYEGYLLDLVVPSTLGGYKVTKIGPDVYNGLNIYKSVVIPEGITDEMIEEMAAVVHEKRLKRNDWVFDKEYGNPILAQEYAKLPEEEKEKDRVQVRQAIQKIKSRK